MPEGTICFAGEPLLEVTAPILEAQLVETVLINQLQLQTMIASKAARCVSAAGGRRLVDFSLRRTHGTEAGLKVARATYLAGFDATSNVLAGKRYGIPLAGTMAHSYVEAFSSEIEAFRAYTRAYAHDAVLLVDTYDSIEGTRRAALVGNELASTGGQLRGVRLDSGDLVGLSRTCRGILDDAGLSGVPIFASGALDEGQIEEIVGAGAPIDGFGVGTLLGVSADAPHLDMAYKLVMYEGRPTLKLSTAKATWPGCKQVWRDTQQNRDLLGLADESSPESAEPLLVPVMVGGQPLGTSETLDVMRERCRRGLAALPPNCRRPRAPADYTVQPTDALLALEREAVAHLGR
jgi:nicotinate phosphoribosyltransferase